VKHSSLQSLLKELDDEEFPSVLATSEEFLNENLGQEELVKALSVMRALYLIHQNCHWQIKGENSFAGHLLFQRLYEAVEKDVDELAEKIVGVYGPEALLLTNQVEDMVKPLLATASSTGDLFATALQAEELALQCLEETYYALEGTDMLSLGIDDLLMGLCSNCEKNIYLLKQQQ